jgi:hypothetical protein
MCVNPIRKNMQHSLNAIFYWSINFTSLLFISPLLDCSRTNTEDTKYVFMTRQQNAGQNIMYMQLINHSSMKYKVQMRGTVKD